MESKWSHTFLPSSVEKWEIENMACYMWDRFYPSVNMKAEFLPDGNGFATYDHENYTFLIQKGTESTKMKVGKNIGTFKISSDQKLLATIDIHYNFSVYDIATKEMLCTKHFEIGNIITMAFTSDNKSIILPVLDNGILMWNSETKAWKRLLHIPNYNDICKSTHVSFSPDGSHIAFAENYIKIYTYPDFKCVFTLNKKYDEYMLDVRFTEDSKSCVFIEINYVNRMLFINANTINLENPENTLEKVTLFKKNYVINDFVPACISPDGSKVAIAHKAGEIHPSKQKPAPSFTIFDTKTGNACDKEFAAPKFEDIAPETSHIDFSPDGKEILWTIKYKDPAEFYRDNKRTFIVGCYDA